MSSPRLAVLVVDKYGDKSAVLSPYALLPPLLTFPMPPRPVQGDPGAGIRSDRTADENVVRGGGREGGGRKNREYN